MISLAPLSMAAFLTQPRGGHALACTSGEEPRGTRETSQSTLLKGLFKKKPKGDLRTGVTSLATDSRRVIPGSLFFALSGYQVDGNEFIDEAIGRGAIGIVSERPHPRICPVPFWTVEDARVALAEVASRFYDHPERALKVTAVTGTNGKTTVAMLAQHLIRGAGPVGLLGTVRYEVGDRTFPAFRTTPDAVDIYALFNQMRLAGCHDVVMEASSHGIEQKRMWGVACEVAVFTNLTQDHLDYHGDFDAYYRAKVQLFEGQGGPPPKKAVINVSDPYGARLADELSGRMELHTFGACETATHKIVMHALSADGARFDLVGPDGVLEIQSPLPGEYNVYNLAAAIISAQLSGASGAEILERLRAFPGVPGRMERIDHPANVHVFVDYAHTPDAIHNALVMLGDVIDGRIHIVFGCGGNRDRTKRPLMLEAALKGAERIYLTADNPRLESLDQIFEDTLAKASTEERQRVDVVRDRREAISVALRAAQPGDCVLIAGKGHENFQEIADALIPFDDARTARELIDTMSIMGGNGA